MGRNEENGSAQNTFFQLQGFLIKYIQITIFAVRDAFLKSYI